MQEMEERALEREARMEARSQEREARMEARWKDQMTDFMDSIQKTLIAVVNARLEQDKGKNDGVDTGKDDGKRNNEKPKSEKNETKSAKYRKTRSEEKGGSSSNREEKSEASGRKEKNEDMVGSKLEGEVGERLKPKTEGTDAEKGRGTKMKSEGESVKADSNSSVIQAELDKRITDLDKKRDRLVDMMMEMQASSEKGAKWKTEGTKGRKEEKSGSRQSVTGEREREKEEKDGEDANRVAKQNARGGPSSGHQRGSVVRFDFPRFNAGEESSQQFFHVQSNAGRREGFNCIVAF